MRKNVITLATIIALGISIASEGTAGVAAAPAAGAAQLQSTWSCETTQANGTIERESDTIELIGKWLHGTARRADGTRGQPFYDYYLGYVHSQWVYIQIDPSSGTPFFVGTSHAGPRALNGSHWSIVYPAGGGNYTVTETAQRFTIAYADLTQVCNKTSPAVPGPPVPTLKCDIRRTGQSPPTGQTAPTEEYLSLSPLEPNWWQGVAVDSPSGGHVIYEYNIFTIHSERISIEINAATGSYTIATSRPARSLNNTTWTVVYPTVENGFTFRDVSPEGALPQQFTTVFADGYQTCARE
jgi:hypothetical protein